MEAGNPGEPESSCPEGMPQDGLLDKCEQVISHTRCILVGFSPKGFPLLTTVTCAFLTLASPSFDLYLGSHLTSESKSFCVQVVSKLGVFHVILTWWMIQKEPLGNLDTAQ